MNQPPSLYDRRFATRYTFVSKRQKGAIIKVVEFTPTSAKNILHLGFGDMRYDGTADDKANNNDIVKVLATIIEIVHDFTSEYPDLKIVFTGNTLTKASLYKEILKMD